MPGTVPQAKIMQPAGDFHDQVADPRLPVADFVLDDATPLHTAHRVLNPHFLARYALVVRFLIIGQFTSTRFLCWLLDHDVCDRKSLKSHVLIQCASLRQCVRFIIDNGLFVPLSSIRPTQKANHTGVIDEQDVLDCMTFLLATVILCLFIGVYGSLDGTFRAIMIKKGEGAAGGAGAVMMVARRAGSTSLWCNA